jgi:hypothetical protein
LFRERKLREIFIFNANPWVGFVVLHHNVVEGLVFFDEVVFQEQSIVLSLGTMVVSNRCILPTMILVLYPKLFC